MENTKNIYLSVVIPAYNEAGRIGITLDSLRNYFSNKDISYEVIIVDDGSKDKTVQIVNDYKQFLPSLKVLENIKNRGKGYSVNRGMKEARGMYRLFMDADNSVDISHIDAFLSEMKNGSDVVIGSIRLKDAEISESAGWYRRALGYMSKLLISICAVPGISDTQRGFKLFSGRVADKIFSMQTIERFGFDIELLVIAWINGLKIKELPVIWNNADGSTVTFKSYFQTLKELTHIVWNRIMGKYNLLGNMHSVNI